MTYAPRPVARHRAVALTLALGLVSSSCTRAPQSSAGASAAAPATPALPEAVEAAARARAGVRESADRGLQGALGGAGANVGSANAEAPRAEAASVEDRMNEAGGGAALRRPGRARIANPVGALTEMDPTRGGYGQNAPPTGPAPAAPPSMQGEMGRAQAATGAQERVHDALTALDANGRFATTYRPGGGNLAAFEASLASGAIPVAARDLVGDLGARYAPAIEAPTPAQGALSMRADLERAAMPPTGGLLRLRLALRSTERAATARPTMSVHLVLDHSGSMQGRPMEDALVAARQLVERLEPRDTFSLTAFSSNAEVLVTAGPVGPRRAAILETISHVMADGGTNIGEGLRMGYAQAARGPQSPDTVQLVLLLSDGRATDGDTNPRALAGMAAQAFQHSVQTSSFGVGTDYDGPLMSSIAEQGSGGYYYVRDSNRIAAALATELDARTQPVAQAVELRVRLRDGVELVQTYGSRRLGEEEAASVRARELAVDAQVARRDGIARSRDRDNEGGMRFFIPGFARADQHVVLLGLRLPEGVGERSLASVELRYKDRILGRNVTTELPLRVRYAETDAASLATLDPSVARTVQGFEAGETLVRAARDVERGRRDSAVALLEEREGLLRAASERLGDPQLTRDAVRLGRYRALLTGGGPREAMSETMVLALLMDTSARGYMH